MENSNKYKRKTAYIVVNGKYVNSYKLFLKLENMNNKKDCGTISHNGKNYKVEWETDTHLVWVIDDKGRSLNSGDAKAINESFVLECAKEMLKSAGF